MTVNLADYVGMEVTSTFKNGHKATNMVACRDETPNSESIYTFYGTCYSSNGWVLGGPDYLDIVDVEVDCRINKHVSVKTETNYLLSLSEEQAKLIMRLMAKELVESHRTSILYEVYSELKHEMGVMN